MSGGETKEEFISMRPTPGKDCLQSAKIQWLVLPTFVFSKKLVVSSFFSCPMHGIFVLQFLGGRLEDSFRGKFIKDCHEVPFGFHQQRGYFSPRTP